MRMDDGETNGNQASPTSSLSAPTPAPSVASSTVFLPSLSPAAAASFSSPSAFASTSPVDGRAVTPKLSLSLCAKLPCDDGDGEGEVRLLKEGGEEEEEAGRKGEGDEVEGGERRCAEAERKGGG
jgi:hypothetical protein